MLSGSSSKRTRGCSQRSSWRCSRSVQGGPPTGSPERADQRTNQASRSSTSLTIDGASCMRLHAAFAKAARKQQEKEENQEVTIKQSHGRVGAHRHGRIRRLEGIVATLAIASDVDRFEPRDTSSRQMAARKRCPTTAPSTRPLGFCPEGKSHGDKDGR